MTKCAHVVITKCYTTSVADPGFANRGPLQARVSTRRGVSTRGGVWGEGSAPSPENFLEFRSKNVDF